MTKKTCWARRFLVPLCLMTFLSFTTAISAHAAPVDEEIHLNGNGIPIQQYQAPDDGNDLHTLYWARGTEPAKMSNLKQNYGKSGYFYRDEVNGNTTFSQAFTFDGEPENYDHAGLYDINKTNNLQPPESRLCYLASSANLFHWWLDQNADYVRRYREGIASGRYQQEPGLAALEDDTNWNHLTGQTPLVKHAPNRGDLMWGQTIFSDPLAGKILYPRYASSTIGGWPDSLSAFFFNGYPPLPADAIPRPEQFTPDRNGGYFHPIFGRTPLAVRHVGSLSYTFYRDNIRQWLLEGKGIGLVYYPKGISAAASSSHAITLWGAEYTSSGELYRVFVSDSDDAYAYGKYDMHDNAQISTAIYSLEAFEEDGKLYLSSGTFKGVRNKRDMEGIIELSLGQDIWKAVMNDPDPTAHAPVIMTSPQSRSYAIGSRTDPLTVEAEIPDADLGKGGYLTYQWYQTDSPDGTGTPIEGQTKASFLPSIGSVEETRYYYCEVTNHKYGKHAVRRTSTAAITTVHTAIVNAQEPLFDSFSPATISCHVGDRPQIQVKASSPDKGQLSYQWFAKLDTLTQTLEEPVGQAQDSPLFVPPTDEAGTFTYYCKITNYNPSATGQRYASVEVTDHAVTVKVAERPPQGTCTVTFSTPGATPMEQISKPRGAALSAAELAEPTRIGYGFTGWYLDAAHQRKLPENMPLTGDLTLYAGWVLDGPSRGREYALTRITVSDGETAIGNTITAKVDIQNISSAEADRLVVAAYDRNGKQLGLTIKPITDDPLTLPNAQGNLPTISVTVQTTGPATCLTAYILPAAGRIVPLSNALRSPAIS